MKRKHPFFLLEAMIAVLLVAIFSYISLQGFYSLLRGQKEAVRALEYHRLVDLKRMDLLVKHWNHVEELANTKKIIEENISLKSPICGHLTQQHFQVSCDKQGNQYLITLVEKRPKEFSLDNKPLSLTHHYLK